MFILKSNLANYKPHCHDFYEFERPPKILCKSE